MRLQIVSICGPLAAVLVFVFPGFMFARFVAAQQQTGSPAGIPLPAPPATNAGRAGVAVSPDAHSFRVLVVNGRTGEPVAGAHIQLWYDDASGTGLTIVSDASGLALLPAPLGMPVRVLVSARDLTECRKHSQGEPVPGYNLQQLAASGMSTGNTCGGPLVRPAPGELVFYVRPPHWYDGIFNQ